MLHILLIILKIIGILLLLIIGIVLLILLAVLMIPICYEVQGEKEEERIKGMATISWLFRGIAAKYIYENKQGSFEVFIFGIPLLVTLQKLRERKAKKEAGKQQKEIAEKTEVQISEQDNLTDKKNESENTIELKVSVEETAEENKTEIKGQTVIKEQKITEKERIESSHAEEQKQSEKKSGLGDKIKSLWNTICGLPQKVTSAREKIRLTIQQMCDKIDWWKTFIQKESTQKALRFLQGEGKAILKHVLPRKLKGNVLYGLEDPALTGQILAVLSAFYPYYQEDLEIVPFFDRNILEGKLKISGRIILGYFVLHGIKIICNREIRKTFKILRRKEA